METRFGRNWMCVTFCCLTTVLAPLSGAAESPDVTAARELLQLWVGGKNDELYSRGTEKLRSAVKAEQLGQAWAGLGSQFGSFKREQSAKLFQGPGVQSVQFTLQFERALVQVRIAVSDDKELAGFQIEKASPVASALPHLQPDSGNYSEQSLLLKNGSYELSAILTLPERLNGSVAGVVFVHGSGPHDADETQGPNRPFLDLARGLALNRVASLRYEKRTRKYGGEIAPELVTLEWETIDDALAAVRLMRERPEIDSKRIFVLGHSLGGMTAPFIAERDPELAGIILMAANARPIVDLIEDQLSYLSGLGGSEGAQAKFLLDQARPAISAIRAGKLQPDTPPLLGAPAAYWAEINRRDALTAAERCERRILVLQGGRDYLVTQKDFALWKSRLEKNSKVTLKWYDQLNHNMIAGDGPGGPADDAKAGTVDPSVITDLSRWVQD